MDKLYGLIGRTLGHSWSAPIHAALGRADYRLFPLEPEELEGFLRSERLGGINVTMPYKQTVIPLCDRLSPTAQAIGSVNTIVHQQGQLVGCNTDAVGFRLMVQRAGVDVPGKKVLVLGSGGASRTVQYVARQLGARQIVVISRSGPDHYHNLSRHADAQLVVNATPVGMHPHSHAAPVDLNLFPRCSGVLDLVYNPQRTELLLQAQALRIPNSDGLPMLVAQAVEAEALFFGHPMPQNVTEQVLAQLRRATTNLVLIGMPGSGKSTVGQLLAAMTGREAVDLDTQLERRTGRSIPDLLTREGEARFRELEHEVVLEAASSTGTILICGGGVVTRPDNLHPLQHNGRIYQLDRALERLAVDGRPLSQQRTPAQLWAEREPLYRRFRDQVIDNNGSPQQAAEHIWRDFCDYSGA